MKITPSVLITLALTISVHAQVAQIACGNNHTLVLKSDGTVKVCGYNAYGQVGDRTTTDRPGFVSTTNLANSSFVGGGGNFSMAVSNGIVWTWGNNLYGQLGDGSTVNRGYPVQVDIPIWYEPADWPLRTDAVAVSGGQSFSVALRADGPVIGVGHFDRGQLGMGALDYIPAPAAANPAP